MWTQKLLFLGPHAEQQNILFAAYMYEGGWCVEVVQFWSVSQVDFERSISHFALADYLIFRRLEWRI